MIIHLSSLSAPISISISGNISEIDYTWKISPVQKYLEKLDLQKLYFHLYKLKKWCIFKGIKLNIKGHWLFKSAFYFFYKKTEIEEA